MGAVFSQCLRVLEIKFDVFGYSISFMNLLFFGIACSLAFWLIRKIYA